MDFGDIPLYNLHKLASYFFFRGGGGGLGVAIIEIPIYT